MRDSNLPMEPSKRNSVMRHPQRPLLPLGPILDWSSFKFVDAPGIASVENLPHVVFTTSGRSAIYQALLQLNLSAGSVILVPTYHCPTMVAPALLAGLNVAYFGIREDGLPKLDTIDVATANNSKVMLVSHYFGQTQSLAEVRQWCDERGIALIEDCAHSYFGEAGDRPVGAWGDFATASLSKFLPVPEGGLLASTARLIKTVQLVRQKPKAQLKGWVDVFELATKFNRFRGINFALTMLFRLKNSKFRTMSQSLPETEMPVESPEASMMRSCNMARISQAPLWATMTLKIILPRGRIITCRQQNYDRFDQYFADTPGARPLFPNSTRSVAPYVFPLWVDDADRIYRSLLALGLPVFRWDRIWPGTPLLEGDVGPQWSQHVLQLLCHQDLGKADIDRTAQTILSLLPHKPGIIAFNAPSHQQSSDQP